MSSASLWRVSAGFRSSEKFRVVVTPEAETEIRESFHYNHAYSPLNAARWLKALYERIDTLERFPERCPHAREREFLEEDLRQLLFKSHRVVFWIDKQASAVHVLRVRHAKRRAIGEPADDDE